MRNKLQETLHIFDRLKNARASIHQLPVELLCRVFFFAIAASTTQSTRKVLVRTRITRTCHHWREIALNNPLFWTQIEVDEGHRSTFKAASAFMARSRNALLDVRFSNSVNGNVGNVDLDSWLADLAANGHRVRSLNLNIGSTTYQYHTIPLSRLTTFTPTNLKHLAIKRLTSQQNAILPPIFSGVTAGLVALDLSGFQAWCPNNFSNLTILTLDSRERNSSQRFTDSLVELLLSSPRLRHLSLKTYNPIGHQFRNNPITLPCLDSLQLISCNTHAILPRLSFECPTQISISNGFPPDTDINNYNILSILPRSFSDTYIRKHYDGLQLVFTKNRITLIFHTKASQIPLPVLKPPTPKLPAGYILLAVDILDFERGMLNSVDSVIKFQTIDQNMRTLALSSQVCDLNIEDVVAGLSPLTVDAWSQWLDRLRNLEELIVDRFMHKHIFEALTTLDSDGKLRCQKLLYLHLYMMFSERDDGYLDSVVRCVEIRAKLGYPLLSLKVGVEEMELGNAELDGWAAKMKAFVTKLAFLRSS